MVYACAGVSARCAAGLSGCAPCRLCRHGHSASIPHALPRLWRCALRLPPRDRRTAYPRRAPLGAPVRVPNRLAPDRPGQRPASDGQSAADTPWLAAAGCANACRPRRWRFVATLSREMVHGHAALPRHGTSTPHPKHATTGCGRVVSARRLGGWTLPASGGKPMKPPAVGCRGRPVPLRGDRPMRPWLVVNPGGGTAAPRASWPQPSGANNFPCAITAFGAFLAGQIFCASRSSTAFRPQAMQPARPPPDGSQQGRDGRDLG